VQVQPEVDGSGTVRPQSAYSPRSSPRSPRSPAKELPSRNFHAELGAIVEGGLGPAGRSRGVAATRAAAVAAKWDVGAPHAHKPESRMVCLVLPAHFLADAHDECRLDVADPPRGRAMPQPALQPGDRPGGSAAAAAADDRSGGSAIGGGSARASVARTESGSVAWRQLLVSPLVNFLTAGKKSGEWIQLSGHRGDFLPGTAGTLLKKAAACEKQAYDSLMEEAEPMRQFVPLFYKEVDISGEPFIEMEDLLGHFTNPCCMDIKMGVRTFLESEVTKKKRRMDLLEKMIKMDPNEPTAEEKANGITKLRYMTYREQKSTSSRLGFRVEGIRLAGEPPKNDFKFISTQAQVEEVIRSFLPPPTSPVRAGIVDGFIGVLRELRSALETSDFFKMHEIIGSSLLLLYDSTGTKGVWMIDFGKTHPVEKPLTHSLPWEIGNHEDGYLVGLEALIRVLELLR